MIFVKITVDSQDIYLQQQADGTWETRSAAPSYAGVYPITITAKGDNGAIAFVGYDDTLLGEFLKLIVEGKSISGDRMLDYLPPIIRDIKEIGVIVESEGSEVDRLRDHMELVLSDAFIKEASERRVREWEQKLKITPSGTLEQRRSFILSVNRGQGKLDEEKIKNMVNAFTGGEAIVSFHDSLLDVKILAPANGDVYLFPDVERALARRVPAHIGLSVRRWYSSWQDIRNNFADWNAINSMGTWEEVKKYIPPQ